MVPDERPIYGVVGEFAGASELLAAADHATAAGYRRMDAYSPFPVEGLSESLGLRRSRIPLVVLLGGLLGGAAGFSMQYWMSVVDYPLNVGGRPLNSWPAFVPVTFEMTILGAALAAVLGMLALNGLPMPYHPLFNVPRFAAATRDGFFLCIEARDPRFELRNAADTLRSAGAIEVWEVPD